MTNRILVSRGVTMVLVECYHNNHLCLHFWVNNQQLDEHGHVPSSLLRARVKHYLQENLGAFDYTEL